MKLAKVKYLRIRAGTIAVSYYDGLVKAAERLYRKAEVRALTIKTDEREFKDEVHQFGTGFENVVCEV